MSKLSLVIIIAIILGNLASCSSSNEGGLNASDLAEGWANEASLDQTVLAEIDVNRIDKARFMLEGRIFLNLEQIWSVTYTNGGISNKCCRETMLDLYPIIRRRVPLESFNRLPLSERIALTNFVKQADSYTHAGVNASTAGVR
jgi:hypothetical protein